MGIDYDMDTAEQGRVEDDRLTVDELMSMRRYAARNDRHADGSRSQWSDYTVRLVDEVLRLRARQREEGDCTCRANYTGSRPGWQVRGDCPVHGATPQQEGEREPESDDLGRTPMESLRDHAREVANEIDEWGDVAPPHINALIEVAKRALDTEPPAEREPDLDELTPRCPACEETMHDCECNPYMGDEDQDVYAEIGAALVLAYEDGRRLQDVVVRADVLRKIRSLAAIADAEEDES